MANLNRGWVFFLLALTGQYFVWNPSGYSMYDAWVEERYPLPWLLLISLVTGTILLTMALAAWRALGTLGCLLLIAFIGPLGWALWTTGLFDPSLLRYAPWFWQPVLALVMSFGLRWPILWRKISGRVGTYEDGV